jgi:hypothetical protein
LTDYFLRWSPDSGLLHMIGWGGFRPWFMATLLPQKKNSSSSSSLSVVQPFGGIILDHRQQNKPGI